MQEQAGQENGAENDVMDSSVIDEISSEGAGETDAAAQLKKNEANETYIKMLRRYNLKKGNLAQFS